MRSSVRQLQGAKSAETRQKLMQATCRLLLSRGYMRLTTPDIAAEAGISRGALTHHFSSKEDLVVHALQYQLRATISEMETFVDSANGQPIPSDAVVDYLWDLMNNGLFYITLEYLSEMRHNPDFKTRMIVVIREFHAALDNVWNMLPKSSAIDGHTRRTMLNATMCLIRGMVGQTISRGDDATYFREMLDFWKASLRLLQEKGVPDADPIRHDEKSST